MSRMLISRLVVFFGLASLTPTASPAQEAKVREPKITDRDAIDPSYTEHALALWDGDAQPDLVEILKFGGGVGPKVEVHVLSGASDYKNYALQTTTDRDSANPKQVAADHVTHD